MRALIVLFLVAFTQSACLLAPDGLHFLRHDLREGSKEMLPITKVSASVERKVNLKVTLHRLNPGKPAARLYCEYSLGVDLTEMILPAFLAIPAVGLWVILELELKDFQPSNLPYWIFPGIVNEKLCKKKTIENSGPIEFYQRRQAELRNPRILWNRGFSLQLKKYRKRKQNGKEAVWIIPLKTLNEKGFKGGNLYLNWQTGYFNSGFQRKVKLTHKHSSAPALRGMGDKTVSRSRIVGPVIMALIQDLKDKERLVRKSAAIALGSVAQNAETRSADKAVPALIETLKDENVYVRKEAAEALKKLGQETPVLIAELKDKNKYVRKEAAKALGKIGRNVGPRNVGPALAEKAVSALIQTLKDKDKSVRKYAAQALGLIGRNAGTRNAGMLDHGPAVAEKAVPALIETLKDKNYDVRRYAAQALGSIGRAGPSSAEKAVAALITALEDKVSLVRWSAAEALGNIGRYANMPDHGPTQAGKAVSRSSVTALTEALKDKNDFVRKAAAEALKKIQKK